ncbi:MAG: hypothetical protein ACRCUS_01765 [Anaerovoracaceae bacterium]
MSKQTLESKKEKKKKTKEVEALLVSDVIPIVDFHGDSFLLKNGKILDILKITCKDLYSASEDEIQFDSLCFDKLYKTYPFDLKIVGINMPTDTEVSQEYIKNKISKTKNPVFCEQLKNKLRELEAIAKLRTDREYYLFFYSDNEDERKDNLIQITRSLSRGAAPLVIEIDLDNKIKIIQKMTNKNLHI